MKFEEKVESIFSLRAFGIGKCASASSVFRDHPYKVAHGYTCKCMFFAQALLLEICVVTFGEEY